MAESLLGSLKQGLMFVLSAPAGTGKTTLVRMLAQEFPSVVESVSCTTRKPRPGEKPGVDYDFCSKETFEEKIAQGAFLEYARVFGDYYGTSKERVEAFLTKGKHVMLVIDTQGAMQLRKNHVNAVFIFISPPSIDVLEERLRGRKADTEEAMEKRLSWAKAEIAEAAAYDYHFINDNLDIAYAILRSIFVAETHKTRSNVL